MEKVFVRIQARSETMDEEGDGVDRRKKSLDGDTSERNNRMMYMLVEHQNDGDMSEMWCWGFATLNEAMDYAEKRLVEFDDLEQYRRSKEDPDRDEDDDEEDEDENESENVVKDKLEWDWHVGRHVGQPPFGTFFGYPRIWQIWELDEFRRLPHPISEEEAEAERNRTLRRPVHQ